MESEPELERLIRSQRVCWEKAPVSLRVNPDVDAKTHPYISTGLKTTSLALRLSAGTQVYARAAALQNIAVTGVDCHIGSQLGDTAPLTEAMGKLVALADELRNDGIPFTMSAPAAASASVYKDEAPIDLNAMQMRAGGIGRSRHGTLARAGAACWWAMPVCCSRAWNM